MVCNNCGFINAEGPGFCGRCGAPLQPAAYGPPPPVNYGPPNQPGYYPQTPPKKKTGLILGIIIGLVVLLGAAAAVYFFVLGTPVTGLWYSYNAGVVLEFREGGMVISRSLKGGDTADYEYDKYGGKGTLTVDNEKGGFTVEKDTLKVDSEHGGAEFKRADRDFDANKFLAGLLTGLYSNQEFAEVIELKEGRVTAVHNGSGDFAGEYDYDMDKGTGTITIQSSIYTFKALSGQIEIEDVGIYTREAEGFDTAAFIAQYGNQIAGKWYSPDGNYGEFDFATDGTITYIFNGKTLTGTYTYDKTAGAGTITFSGSTGNFTLSDGTLTIEGKEFKRDYVEQKDADDIYADIAGTWYDKTGYGGTAEFGTDGTASITVFGSLYSWTVNFDPLAGAGSMTLSDNSGTMDFMLTGQDIVIGGTIYGRDPVEQQADPVCTIWYDVTG